MKLRAIIISWDFAVSLLLTAVVVFWLPRWVPNELAKDYYNVGISVLSIVFALFFAALAIVITSSDDEFVLFMEAEGDYSALVSNYKFSLGLLFASLIYSIGCYAYTAESISVGERHQRKAFVVVFCLLFLWSLFAAFKSTYD